MNLRLLDPRSIRRAYPPLQSQLQGVADAYFNSPFAAPVAAPCPAFCANSANPPESSSWLFAPLVASDSFFTVTGFLVVFAFVVLFIFLGIRPALSFFPNGTGS